MKDDVRRLELLELDEQEISQRRVWQDLDGEDPRWWVSLDPNDPGDTGDSGWWEKSRVAQSASRGDRAVKPDGRLHPVWWVISVVACTVAVASMTLLPVLLNAYLGGWAVDPRVWLVCAALIVVMTVGLAVMVGGRWGFAAGAFVSVLMCTALVCLGVFSAQIFGLPL